MRPWRNGRLARLRPERFPKGTMRIRLPLGAPFKGSSAGHRLASKTDFAGFDSLGSRHLGKHPDWVLGTGC